MLVVDVDRLGKRQVQALQAMPFQQRFAFTVFTGFAVALALIAVLFALSADPSPRSQITRFPSVAQDDPRLAVELGQLGTRMATSAMR